MTTDYSKIVGWLVFFAGLILIVWTLYYSYNIFTAKTAVLEFFTISQQNQTSLLKSGTQDVQTQLQQMIGEQLKSFIPEGSITKILNLTIFSLLAFILIFGGTQISGLGIKLLRK